VVKKFWRKAASPSCHPHCGEWIRPILPPYNTCFLRPTWVSPQRQLMLFSGWTAPKNCHFPLGDRDPHLMHDFLGQPDSAPKLYLDRFSRLRRADERDQQTDRHTQSDRPRHCVGSNMAAMRPNNNKWSENFEFFWWQTSLQGADFSLAAI